jgi:thiol-disulfide isomerase/thioredoxin
MYSYKKGSVLVFSLLVATVSVAAKLPSADKVLADARAKAGAQKKNVMLVFESSWCPPCQQFDRFVADPRIRSIVDHYFVLATLAVGEEVAGNANRNNPGSAELLMKLGGVHFGSTGVPFIFVIDPKGTIIVTSERPVSGQSTGENIGYPIEPEEIEWFMQMMKKGATSLSEEDARTVDGWLRRNAG